MSAGREAVLWHDLECGSYVEDRELWRALAAESGARGILDVGAGSGRVALDLARRDHAVTAVDLDAELLDALRERASAAGVRIQTVVADACALDLPGRRFGLIIVPMQTVQLFGGPSRRAEFLRRARRHLHGGGVLAMAIADPRDGVTDDRTEPPRPDLREVDGVIYASRAIGLRDEGDAVAIERIREVVDRAGERRAEGNVVRLDIVDAATLEGEGRAAGLRVLTRREVPETEEYVGSSVVMLGA